MTEEISIERPLSKGTPNNEKLGKEAYAAAAHSSNSVVRADRRTISIISREPLDPVVQ